MATNAVNNAAKAVSGAVNAAVNAANKAANGATNVASNLFTNVTNQVANAGKGVNSIIPFMNTPKANNGRANNGAGAGAAPPNATRNVINSLPAAANFNVAPNTTSPWAWPLGIFIALVGVFLLIFAIFNKQIKEGYEYIFTSIRQALGLPTNPAVEAAVIPMEGRTAELVIPPEAPQDVTPNQESKAEQIVEKLLPLGSESKEVFNVSQNKFSFYDAEPLCKALGAELATYEQVKSAWERGADWCNYGWVKGQMAVYPTQQGTYDKLQSGPVEERMACGTVGLNGGFFDNPEMKYGVNCYGKKPSQTAHDEATLMSQGKVPPTPEMLKVDQKMNEFKRDADGLFVQPFNEQKWSDALF